MTIRTDLNKDNNSLSTNSKIMLFLYMLYIILSPFYFWKSGLPQVADFVLILLVIFCLLSSKFKFSLKQSDSSILILGLIFVFWILIVNLIWTLILDDSLLRPILYYIYNFLALSLTVVLYNKLKERLLIATYYGVLISVFIQLILFLIDGFSGRRVTGSFNNPNQLGFYSLLLACILIFLKSKIKVNFLWLIGLISCAVLSFASLSKAAMLSFGFLITTFILSAESNKKQKRRKIAVVILIIILFTVFYNTSSFIQNNLLLESVYNRLSDIGKADDDNLASRGYLRIVDYPQYWFFGAGEGAFYRFNANIEFHSIIGNIQVSYGIVGTLLFLSILLVALKKNKYKYWYIIASVMFYGLTHNGIRQTLFWILLVLLTSHEYNKEKGLVNKHVKGLVG